MPTENELANKKIHTVADKIKSDLNQNVADHVSDGSETSPPERVDPMAARKAMFKKADALRESSGTTSPVTVPTEQVEAMQREAAGQTPGTPVEAQPASVPETPEGGVKPPVQNSHEYVTLEVEGRTIQVTKADIDRQGGVDGYLRNRRQAEDFARDRATLAETQRQLDETRRLLKESKQATPAGHDGPANSSAAPAERGESSGTTEQDTERLAQELAQQIYSGDRDDVQAAILKILQRSKGQTLSVEEVAARVRSALPVQPAAVPATVTPQPPVNPRVAAINQQINDMARSDYADVVGSEVARTATFAYFKELVSKPENKDRLAVDVARDACDWGREKFFGNPREKIVEQKRGLPSSTVAGGANQGSAESEALTPSQVVAMQSDFRNFGRRIKQ